MLGPLPLAWGLAAATMSFAEPCVLLAQIPRSMHCRRCDMLREASILGMHLQSFLTKCDAGVSMGDIHQE